MKGSLILAVLWTIIFALLSEYYFMPVWDLSFGSGIWLTIIVYLGGLGGCLVISESTKLGAYLSFCGAALAFVVMLIIGIYSWDIFHATANRNLIGEVKPSEFTADISPVSTENMILLNADIARRISEKVLGTKPGLASSVEIGEYTLQTVKGKQYWIAPLLHAGFWKWLQFDGTPGYIAVSATNPEDYRLVENAGGKSIKLVYQPGSYFSQDLERHIYTSGYRGHGFGDFTFEVDDEWRPFWTITVYDSKIGFFGDDAIGMLTVDPETGTIAQYPIDKAPTWSERIQPIDFVKNQVDNWGEFVHGWPNWSGRDKMEASDDVSIIMGADGNTYYYIGLQGKNSSGSTTGFMLINSRSKEAKWYHMVGATETAARGSAEGKVQREGYTGSEGVAYNIDGYPTYEFLMLDKAGLVKKICLVSVHNHEIVGVGDTRQEAIRDYKNQMSSLGNASYGSKGSNFEQKTFTGVVKRISNDKNGVAIVITGLKKILTTSTNTTPYIGLTQVGDTVTVTYYENGKRETEITAFQNLSADFSDGEIPPGTENIQETRNTRAEQEGGKALDSKWEKLDPAAKRRILDAKQSNQ